MDMARLREKKAVSASAQIDFQYERPADLL